MWSGKTAALAVMGWTSLAVTTAATAVNSPEAFYSSLLPCPVECGGTLEVWTVYSSVSRLDMCTEPILFDFALHNPLDDPVRTVKLRTCTAHSCSNRSTNATCISASESKHSLDLMSSGVGDSAASADLQVALDRLQSYMSDPIHCGTEILAAYNRKVVIAVWSGSGIDNAKTIPSVMKQLKAHTSPGSKSMTLQLCGSGRNADYTFGVAIDTTGDVAAVQEAALAWSQATCIESAEAVTQLTGVSVFQAPLVPVVNLTPVPSDRIVSSHRPQHTQAARDIQPHHARDGTCRTVTAISGDSCGSLASKCGISPADFTKYNSAKSFCSTLQVGSRACCTSGSLPDITPKENANGTCATYAVQPGDWCDKIAIAHGLSSSDIDRFNDKTTWGWNGCKDLMAGMNICLSSGTPPLPAPVSNAVCGPMVPGTKYPNASETMADLNPCPLNVCCDIWGQCGQTPDFCTAGSGPTGNPGTAPKRQNGCISNCGLAIHNNDTAPVSFLKVGYYESWNWDRPCLNYKANDLADSDYTHAHWAFASIGPDYTVFVNDTMDQLPLFLQIPQKKILSLGGWGISTSPATYNELRYAMDPGNVDTFVTNIVNYLNDKGFDGVDIDWEYPGAPDIPNIPPGLKSDGPNYLAFLKKLRAKLPSEKSMSIAAPASFWYLKAFPIAEMANELDYIVFMTYDLHGQWDWHNPWSQPGCMQGDCMRCHVNLTETMYSMSMVTKAGVPAEKVVVGVASYGRSFGMANPKACRESIYSPECTFTGPLSGAAPGVCTQTPGYIANAEIQQLLDLEDGATYAFDQKSDSDMAYNGTTWIGFMTPTTKSTRTSYYQGFNFGGTVEWAVDLEQWTGDTANPWGNFSDLPNDGPLAPCDSNYATLEDLEAAADSIPYHCVTQYTLNTLNQLLNEAMDNYTTLNNDGYNSKFQTYANAIADEAGQNVHDFVYQNGDKYFSCLVTETEECCSTCKSEQANESPSYCDWCFTDDSCYTTKFTGDGAGQVQVPNTKFVNESEPCPPNFSKRGYGTTDQTVYWALEDSKGFYADLYSSTGIPQAKTKIGQYDRNCDCFYTNPRSEACWNFGMDFDIPVPDGYSASDVANPKDVVKKVQGKISTLGPQIQNIQTLLSMDGWFGDGTQLIDAVSMPILMLAQATENMEQVVTVANEIDAEKRKALIMEFLTAIFLFIPIVGEVAGSIGALADISTVLTMVGAAGNAATDIYGMVSSKQNQPLMIMDLILTPLALGDLATIGKAAQVKRGMKEEDLLKLGSKVASRMKSLEKVKGNCLK